MYSILGNDGTYEGLKSAKHKTIIGAEEATDGIEDVERHLRHWLRQINVDPRTISDDITEEVWWERSSNGWVTLSKNLVRNIVWYDLPEGVRKGWYFYITPPLVCDSLIEAVKASTDDPLVAEFVECWETECESMGVMPSKVTLSELMEAVELDAANCAALKEWDERHAWWQAIGGQS